MEKYIDKEICKTCGGKCCKKSGCRYLPEDFKSMDYEYLLNLIKEGNISIVADFFQVHGNEELYDKYKITKESLSINRGFLWSYCLALKVRNINSDIIDLSNEKSACSMLTENGCKYNDDERPSLGLSLIPVKPNGPCKQKARKYDVYITYDWVKHQQVMEQIVYTLTNKTASSLIEEMINNNDDYKFLNKIMPCYIDAKDAIESEFNYINIEINDKTNVKNLILK